jgi:hypothetical protein
MLTGACWSDAMYYDLLMSSSFNSNHIAFNTASNAATGNPSSQAKYHIIKLLVLACCHKRGSR